MKGYVLDHPPHIFSPESWERVCAVSSFRQTRQQNANATSDNAVHFLFKHHCWKGWSRFPRNHPYLGGPSTGAMEPFNLHILVLFSSNLGGSIDILLKKFEYRFNLFRLCQIFVAYFLIFNAFKKLKSIWYPEKLSDNFSWYNIGEKIKIFSWVRQIVLYYNISHWLDYRFSLKKY